MSWTIVCFSSVDWESHRQRPQIVMSTFANRGHRVIFVDNLGVRLPRFRDIRRVGSRLRHWSKGPIVAPNHPNLEVHSPVVPPPHSRVASSVARRALLRRLRHSIPRETTVIVWSYIPLPLVSDIAQDLRADLLVFDWCDDFSQRALAVSRRHRNRIREWEEDLTSTADVVFVASQALEHRSASGTNAILTPHGIAQPEAYKVNTPPEIDSLPSPKIGFIGAISPWIDLDLLAEMAEQRPDWSIVLVGPLQTKASKLAKKKNIFLLKEMSHHMIPAVVRAFDVGLIPYRLSAATEAASPVKLREYLSGGLPVVSVDLPEVRLYSPPVRIASGTDGFIAATEEALGESRPSVRNQVVRTWDDVADEMAEAVGRALRR